ncbi:MAG: sigma-70 family RNA polymerase sigma factor [Planctomycetia bacterium]|nr:sigma-70 family RNA polymerase sigma factor [Planctomycetia bacterium]
MTFPETRQTLIRRLATASSEHDWGEFLSDYWGPICRFAARRASLSEADAEDVASQTFAALLSGELLVRWQTNRAAKLRTLLCTVVRNVLSNQTRVQSGRERLLKQHAEQAASDGPLPVATTLETSEEQIDAFYAAWVEDLLARSVDKLRDEYHAAGKGDYFRVLYGRVCEEMSVPEISAALGLKPTDVENYYKAAKKRLAETLKDSLRAHTARYCDEAEMADEFQAEWAALGNFVEAHGGLERAVHRSYAEQSPASAPQKRSTAFSDTLIRYRQQARPGGRGTSGADS